MCPKVVGSSPQMLREYYWHPVHFIVSGSAMHNSAYTSISCIWCFRLPSGDGAPLSGGHPPALTSSADYHVSMPHSGKPWQKHTSQFTCFRNPCAWKPIKVLLVVSVMSKHLLTQGNQCIITQILDPVNTSLNSYSSCLSISLYTHLLLQ